MSVVRHHSIRTLTSLMRTALAYVISTTRLPRRSGSTTSAQQRKCFESRNVGPERAYRNSYTYNKDFSALEGESKGVTLPALPPVTRLSLPL